MTNNLSNQKELDNLINFITVELASQKNTSDSVVQSEPVEIISEEKPTL
jgi:hypothetical protein